MTPVPVTLIITASCVALNIWHAWRIGKLRQQFKVGVGDGGHEPLLRRMRAQANFIENAPFVLILLGGLELSGGNRAILAGIGALFILARISHAVGMDRRELQRWRIYGMMATTLVNVVLIVWTVLCVVRSFV
jgi:uncharacterized protein